MKQILCNNLIDVSIAEHAYTSKEYKKCALLYKTQMLTSEKLLQFHSNQELRLWEFHEFSPFANENKIPWTTLSSCVNFRASHTSMEHFVVASLSLFKEFRIDWKDDRTQTSNLTLFTIYSSVLPLISYFSFLMW